MYASYVRRTETFLVNNLIMCAQYVLVTIVYKHCSLLHVIVRFKAKHIHEKPRIKSLVRSAPIGVRVTIKLLNCVYDQGRKQGKSKQSNNRRNWNCKVALLNSTTFSQKFSNSLRRYSALFFQSTVYALFMKCVFLHKETKQFKPHLLLWVTSLYPVCWWRY